MAAPSKQTVAEIATAAPLLCDDDGPYIDPVGHPRCVRPFTHDGPHQAHESWGEVMW